MHFRSTADLAACIRNSAHRLPADCDIVLGIPRSGMLPAAMIALLQNKPLADLEGFLAGRVMGRGHTRALKHWSEDPSQYRHALLVDDTVNKGTSMRTARAQLAECGAELAVTTLAVYAHERSVERVDHCIEICPQPRIFEWNLMHAWLVGRGCFEFEGVLCRPPSEAERADPGRYATYLRDAKPLARPAGTLQRVLALRPERFRAETEAWLARHDIACAKLEMQGENADPDAAARECASAYRAAHDAVLYLAGDPARAEAVAKHSGKPVLDYANMWLVEGDPGSTVHRAYRARQTGQRAKGALARRLRRWFG